MLPLVVTAGVLWADLASPLTQAEYAQVCGSAAGRSGRAFTPSLA